MRRVLRWLLYSGAALIVVLLVVTVSQQHAIIREQQMLLQRYETERRLEAVRRLVDDLAQRTQRSATQEYDVIGAMRKARAAEELNRMSESLARLERDIAELKGEWYIPRMEGVYRFSGDDF